MVDGLRVDADEHTTGERPVASALVRVLDRLGGHVGFGLLLAPGMVVTCAHVVVEALDESDELAEAPTRPVLLDFPFIAEGLTVTARVVVWQAMADDGTGDIAGLELLEDPPEGARYAGMVRGQSLSGHEILAYGYQSPARAGAPTWVPGRIVGHTAQGWLQLGISDLTGGLRIRSGFSGTPVWDPSNAQIIGLVTQSVLGQQMWLSYALSGDLVYAAWPELRAFFDQVCPFRGLAPFGAADRDLFFGRAELAVEAANLITGQDHTVVTGASGVGKTSLIAAAVAQEIANRGHAVLPINPLARDSLWESVAAALAARIGPDLDGPNRREDEDKENAGLERRLKDDFRAESPRSRVNRLCDLLGKDRIVLLLDQFEEILHEDPDRARGLVAELRQLSAIRHPHGRPYLRVVLVIREDLVAELLAVAPYGDDPPSVLRVDPLTDQQLRAAVEGPLRRSGYARYEDGLVDRIVDDIRVQPYALPALQVVLTELWHRKTQNGVLRLSVYDELSRGQGPLTKHLERIWDEIAADVREDARHLFLHLVIPLDDDSFVRRTVSLDELGPAERRAAEILAAGRLVVLRGRGRGEATVELVHDALIERWPTLADHLRRHREFLRKRDDLRRQRSAWRRAGQDNAHLLRGSALKEAISWLNAGGAEIGEGERAFVAASREHRRIRRRTAALLGGAIVTVFALAAGVAVTQTLSAERTQGGADADRMAATAQELLTTRPDVAKQLAVAAYRRAPTPAAIGALVQSMTAPGVIDPPAPVVALAYTGDGRSVLLGTAAKTFIWDVREHRVTGSLSGWRGDLTALAAHPDGRTVAVSSKEGDVQLWDIGDRARPVLVARLPAVSPAATRLLFSPDGSRLVAALDPNRDWADPGESAVRVWDVTQVRAPRPLVVLVSGVGREPMLSFGSAGRVLAIGGTSTVLVDLNVPGDPRRLAKTATENGVLSARSDLLIGRQGNTVQVWSVRAPSRPQLIGHISSDIPLKGKTVLSPDGRLAVFGRPAGVIDLSKAENPVPFPTCMGTRASPGGMADDPPLALSPDGRTLASAGQSGIEIRNLSEPACSGAAGALSGSGTRAVAAIRTDGRFLAVSDTLDGLTTAYIGSGLTPRVLDRMPMTASGTQNFTAAIAVSGDGRTLASSGSDDTVRLWRWTGTKATKLAEIPGPSTSVEALALDDEGKELAAASTGLITLWNLDHPGNPQKMTINEQRTATVQAVALDQQHHLLANAYDDAVQLWDISQPARPLLVATLPGHAGGVNALRFSPPSRTLLSGGADGTVRVWDVASPRSASLMTTLTGHTAPVTAVSLSGNARLVASGDETGIVRLWQRSPGRQAALVGTLGSKGGPSITSVDLSSDGRRLAVSDMNGLVLLWNVEPEAMIRIVCAGVATPIAKADWNQLARGLEYRPPCAS